MKRFYIILITAILSSPVDARLIKNQVLSLDGLDRTYDIFVPDVDGKQAKPLVLLLHGHFGNADVMTGENGKSAPYKTWLSIAEREGWYLAIPDGEEGSDDHRGWNDCRQDAGTNPKTDDVKFLLSLVEQVSSEYRIDQSRLFAHGTSNGGNMVFRLAQQHGDKFKAVAAVVASMPATNKCEESKHPISILVMNGTEDPLLLYEGGKIGRRNTAKYDRGSVISTDETIQYWVNNNKITTNPTIQMLPNLSRTDRSTVEVTRYSGGSDNTAVVLYKIIGGGHTEPSMTEHFGALYKVVVGKQNRDIEMAEEVWRFFDSTR